jgi:uncharacterized RDD family membrane protein YckC
MVFWFAGPLKNREIFDSYPQVSSRTFGQSSGSRSTGQKIPASEREPLSESTAFLREISAFNPRNGELFLLAEPSWLESTVARQAHVFLGCP